MSANAHEGSSANPRSNLKSFNIGPYEYAEDAIEALEYIAQNANSIPEPELSETCANAASFYRTFFDAAALLSTAYKELKVLYDETTVPILHRAIQDHAFGEISRTVFHSCLESLDLSSDPRIEFNLKRLQHGGGVSFRTYKQVLICALAEDPLQPLGAGTDEKLVTQYYFNKDGTLRDLGQILREAMQESASDKSSAVRGSSPQSTIANRMALCLLERTEEECTKLDLTFFRMENESKKLLAILFYIFPRLWSRFRANLEIIANHNQERFDEHAEPPTAPQDPERLKLGQHIIAFLDFPDCLENPEGQASLDDADSNRIQQAYDVIWQMLPAMTFMLEPRLLAYLVTVYDANADRKQANDIAHPKFQNIKEGLKDLDFGSAGSGSDVTADQEARDIFKAMDSRIHACNALLTSADSLMASIVLGR